MKRYLSIIVGTFFTLAALQGAAQAPAPAGKPLLEKTLAAQVLLDQYQGRRGSLEQAAKLVSEVLEVNPKFVPAYVQAARISVMGGHVVSYKFKGGSIERAEAILLQAKAIEPDNAEVHGLLGHVYFLKGDTSAALQSLNRARELNSPNPWLNCNFGDIYQKLDKYDEAKKHYRVLEALGPGTTAQQRRAYLHAMVQLQWVSALTDDNPEVLRTGKLATDAAPADDAWTWGNVANTLFVQGYFDESVAHSRKALSIMDYGVGRSTLALGLYGQWATLVFQGKKDQAEPVFKEAYALYPDAQSVIDRFRSTDPVVRKKLLPIVRARMAEMPR